MRSLPLIPLLALSLITATLVRAQQQPPPVDPKAILAQLQDLKTKQTQILGKEKSQVLAAINAAMADPAKAYETAVLAVEIQGKGGNEGGRMSDWRKSNGDNLRNRDFLTAIRYELFYLSVTWQRYMGATVKDLLPALYDYTSQVTANYDSLWSSEHMKRGLNESIFVAYFQIGPYINGIQDWEMSPLNVDSIFQKTILPELRKDKDPRLLAYWDDKLQTEAAHVDKGGNNSLAVNKFNNIRRPILLWDRAEDELILGDTDRAVADMLALIKAHPDHPDYDKWVARLTDIVTPKPGDPSSPAPLGGPGC